MFTKADAIELFGTPGKLAKAMGVNPNTVSRWPDQLTQSQCDEVVGLAIRVKGLKKTQVFFPHYFGDE